jgi:hypothetical protein
MFTHVKKNIIEHDGQTYEINDSFNNVLLLVEMLEDDMLEDGEKLALAVEIATGVECLNDEGLTQEVDWLLAMYDKVIDYLFDKKADDEEQNDPIYNFTQDSELIYASFLQDYNIDLLNELDKLSFTKFSTLLRQLSDDTPFKKAVGYRVTKIPPLTKYNKDQVEHLKAMKRVYALKKDNKPKNNDKALDSVFGALKGR